MLEIPSPVPVEVGTLPVMAIPSTFTSKIRPKCQFIRDGKVSTTDLVDNVVFRDCPRDANYVHLTVKAGTLNLREDSRLPIGSHCHVFGTGQYWLEGNYELFRNMILDDGSGTCEIFYSYYTTLPRSRIRNQQTGFRIGTFSPSIDQLQNMVDLFTNYVRKSLGWTNLENSAGVYTWTDVDNLLADLENNSLKGYFELCYNNELYYTAAENTYANSLAAGLRDKLAVRTDANIEGFINWALAALERYQGYDIWWEIWNEPNSNSFWKPEADVQEYLAFTLPVCRALKAAYPNEQIAVGATSGIDLEFIKALADGGLFDFIDAISIHPYRYTHPETMLLEIERIRAYIDGATGRDIAIHISEMGHSLTLLDGYMDGRGVRAPADYEATAGSAGTTNLLVRSSEFDNASWLGYYQKPTVTTGIVDPLGGTNACKLSSSDYDAGGGAGENYSGVRQAGTPSDGAYYTVSCWMRTDGSPLEVQLGLCDGHSRLVEIDGRWKRYSYTLKCDSGEGALTRLFQVFETTESNVDWYVFGAQTELLSGYLDADFNEDKEICQMDWWRMTRRVFEDSPASMLIWYELDNSGTDLADSEDNFGLFLNDSTPKAGFSAASTELSY